MSESMALVKSENQELVRWEILKDQAAMLAKSRLMPKHIQTVEQAIAAMMMADELGVPRTLGMGKIYFINGNMSIAPELLIANAVGKGIIKDHWAEEKPDSCTYFIQRNDRDRVYQGKFTMAEATKAGLAGKDNWKNYGSEMLLWRAVMRCLKRACPEVTMGLHSPDEMGEETDNQGSVLPGVIIKGTEPPEVSPSVKEPLEDMEATKKAQSFWIQIRPRLKELSINAEEFKAFVLKTFEVKSSKELIDSQREHIKELLAAVKDKTEIFGMTPAEEEVIEGETTEHQDEDTKRAEEVAASIEKPLTCTCGAELTELDMDWSKKLGLKPSSCQKCYLKAKAERAATPAVGRRRM